MFLIGKNYKDKSGKKHTVLMHNLHGIFPVITKDEKGKLTNFTREGHFYRNRASDKDLIDE